MTDTRKSPEESQPNVRDSSGGSETMGKTHPDPIAINVSGTVARSEPSDGDSETATRAKPVEVSGRAQTPARRGKPDFTTFFDVLSGVVAGKAEKGSFSQVMKILKAGFSDRPSPDHINRLFDLLRDWPECSRVAFLLYIETRKQRSSELIRSLRNRFITHARVSVEFPNVMGGQDESDWDRRAQTVLDWLDRQLSEGTLRSDTKKGRVDLPCARWTLICLMEEPAPFIRYSGAYRVLDRIAGREAEDGVSVPELDFLAELGTVLTMERLNVQRLQAGLRTADFARMVEDQCRQEFRKVSAVFRESQGRSIELAQEVALLRQRLQETEKSLFESVQTCQQRDMELAEQRAERAHDREHWKDLSEQSLTKLVNSIKTRLGHEVKEARISLNQETPNVRFALERLNRIEKTLERLKDE